MTWPITMSFQNLARSAATMTSFLASGISHLSIQVRVRFRQLGLKFLERKG